MTLSLRRIPMTSTVTSVLFAPSLDPPGRCRRTDNLEINSHQGFFCPNKREGEAPAEPLRPLDVAMKTARQEPRPPDLKIRLLWTNNQFLRSAFCLKKSAVQSEQISDCGFRGSHGCTHVGFGNELRTQACDDMLMSAQKGGRSSC